MSFSDIPVVDVSKWTSSSDPLNRKNYARDLVEICHRVGFFVVTGHGIEDDLFDKVFTAMKDLFALSEEEKQCFEKRKSRHFRGWEKVGSELTNGKPDIREQLDVWTENEPHAPDVLPEYLRLLGPNQWPSDKALPGFKDLAQHWARNLQDVAEIVMDMLSLGLGMNESYIRDFFGTDTFSLTKYIHYPTTPQGSAGVGAHNDTGFLTILAPGSSGLQAMNPQGKWIDVPLIKGGLVVNIGEALQALSGNYLVATMHRVIAGNERYSTAFFHSPSLSTPLRPFPLYSSYTEAVADSPRHANAGYMAKKEEIDSGNAKEIAKGKLMQCFGEQTWNYFERSYPDMVALHYPDTVAGTTVTSE